MCSKRLLCHKSRRMTLEFWGGRHTPMSMITSSKSRDFYIEIKICIALTFLWLWLGVNFVKSNGKRWFFHWKLYQNKVIWMKQQNKKSSISSSKTETHQKLCICFFKMTFGMLSFSCLHFLLALIFSNSCVRRDSKHEQNPMLTRRHDCVRDKTRVSTTLLLQLRYENRTNAQSFFVKVLFTKAKTTKNLLSS